MPTEVGSVVELLQDLIRNECVSTGFAPSEGTERKNADLLRTLLDGSGADLETFEHAPGRTSLIARLAGSDPTAPSVCVMGHTDVVPVNRAAWSRDPFGGELIDNEIWGRGAVDMLNQTAAMAVAFRRLAESGFQPTGDLVYLAVADEECGGQHGAAQILEEQTDLVLCDYVLTEIGGPMVTTPTGPGVEVGVAEKGVCSCRVRVVGKPAHASAPWGSDNAVVKAAEVIRRLAAFRPQTRISDTWREWVRTQGFDADLAAVLIDPERLWDALPTLPGHVRSRAHACNHRTVTPTVIRGGTKVNVIPDEVEIGVDQRLAVGESVQEALADLRELVADIDGVTVEIPVGSPATVSSTDTPMWGALQRAARTRYEGATLVPTLFSGGTDARYFRQKGAIGYGFNLFEPTMDARTYWSRFHGNDERIDVDSLLLSTRMWEGLLRDFLG